MKIKKIGIVVAVLALIAAAIVTWFYLRRAPVDAAALVKNLPPDMELYVVLDVDGLASNPIIRGLLLNSDIEEDPEYTRFTEATGFHYQKDLHQAAVARSGDDWVGVARVTVDHARAIRYMESHGAQKTSFRDKTVYSFGKVRRLRIVFLDDDPARGLVAFTIGGEQARIEQAVERWAGVRHDSAASEIEQFHVLEHVPQGSTVWAVGLPERLWPDNSTAKVGSFGLNGKFFRGSKVMYASLQTPIVELTVEDLCDGESSAERIAGSLQGMINLIQALPAKKNDDGAASRPDVKTLVSGIEISQTGASVFLHWKLDQQVLKFLMPNSR